MKNTKKAIMAAVILVAAGLAIAFGGMAAMNFDFNKMNTLHFTTNTYSVDESFTNISIETAECDIRLLPSEDDSCKVVCEESKEIFHTVSVKNNTLTIDRTDARKWYKRIVGIYWGDMTITVYLPQTAYASLSVLNVSGNTAIPEDFTFTDAKIRSTSGNIDFLAPVEKDLSLKTVSGNLHAEGTNPKSLDAQSTSGDIDYADSIVSDDMTIDTVSGKIRCSNVSASGDINMETTSGKVTLSGVTAAKAIQIETVSGNIELKSCDADTLWLKSTSGKVSGTLLTKKKFLTDTTSGRINVPQSSSGGKCEIKTTSGNIQFEIE